MAARALLRLLALYKRWISPLLPRACRFEPTCSEYARLAILKYGALEGSIKAAGRVLRCHPFHPGGIDRP
ncbi:MAG: membrane protein insertion efficiency factor YidD [Thermoanaerobaculia bacterium]|nr:membrane protein insertion efficiency factor YidD [Thermoanaerobaculia bacterium]